VRFSESAWDLSQTAPSLSEHNHEVYRGQLGYSEQQFAKLKKMRII
jgi:crotonobetainyl-CoA:carnitine CoA-transferase CaiB-like acyl-CoA transferase